MSDEFDSGILTDCMKCGKLKVTIGFCKKCIDKQIKKAREEVLREINPLVLDVLRWTSDTEEYQSAKSMLMEKLKGAENHD